MSFSVPEFTALLGYSPQELQAIKALIVDQTGLAKDALHIFFGMAMFLFVRLVWRMRGGWLLAWGATLAMALAVEYVDIVAQQTRTALQPDDNNWHDIWVTMLIPTVLLLLGPWLQPRKKAPKEAAQEVAIQAETHGSETTPPSILAATSTDYSAPPVAAQDTPGADPEKVNAA